MKGLNLLLLLVAPLLSARVVQSRQQIPILGENEKEPAPSIGVHFTTSYAVAAARYENGTTKDLAKVTGNAEYIGLMSRWMDSWKADPSITKSQQAALPTTGDTAILSIFFFGLRTAIETAINTSVTHIAPTTFPLGPAQEQAFRGALALAGLPSSDDKHAIYREAEAVYTTLHHKSLQPCHPTQRQDILFLAFDNSSFSASTYQLSCHPSTTKSQQLNLISHIPRSALGWWNMPVDDLPQARFWAKVQDCIIDAVDGLGKPPGRIVLLGSHGADKEFKSVVEKVFWREWEVDVGMLLRGDDKVGLGGREWVAARGAVDLGCREG
jgi:hypothetical protein